jgi:NADPH:quinone reductase-like Zn-dependent oxidoreductase
MKAVIMTEYGDASCLQIHDVEKPEIGEDEVLVRVLGSSVNPVDWKVRRGGIGHTSCFPAQRPSLGVMLNL